MLTAHGAGGTMARPMIFTETELPGAYVIDLEPIEDPRGFFARAWSDQEVKLVRCTGGALHDVIVDLRPDSSTFRRWIGVELSQDNRRTLYVPRGFAPGLDRK